MRRRVNFCWVVGIVCSISCTALAVPEVIPGYEMPGAPHVKAVTEGGKVGGQRVYPERVFLSPEQVKWTAPVTDYAPVDYTHSSVIGAAWADPEDPRARKTTEFPTLSSKEIFVDHTTGRPLNYMGRTGLQGRGLLGKWGANFAADPIFVANNNLKQLCVLLIQRVDNDEWALPGGMVDFGEKASVAAKRELFEETRVDMTAISEGMMQLVYEGYMDDPRNTDNSWMETSAYVITVPGVSTESLAVDETAACQEVKRRKWEPVQSVLSGEVPLYAEHTKLMRLARERGFI